ncbi:hypothetical protein [Actinokineospora inagensis]|uniref:hypothetical protein n=1 Tax=Actinokineospora inagensis TaxID=103730 RepID=UPI0004089BBA|nr:hypothetical protein [Actinokineospora inagensis]
MTDEVHDLLGRAFGEEPPMAIDRAAVVADGRRRLRKRRLAATGGVAAMVAVAVFGTAALTSGAFGLGQPGTVAPAGEPTMGTAASGGPQRPSARSSTSRAAASPSTTKPLVHEVELPGQGKVLLSAGLHWPEGVELRSAEPGYQWYDFADAGALKSIVHTSSGDRVLRVRVYFTKARDHEIKCVDPQTRDPLPHCYQQVVSGSLVRTDKDYEQGPVAVLVTADRPDGVTVEVSETSTDDGVLQRADQVLSDATLIRIATLSGFYP